MSGDRFYDAAVVERHRGQVRSFLEEHGSATAADLKEAMGITRKYAMPLLELFDAEGLTRRDGDLRLLAK